jgi:hypothetical protein
VVVAEARWHGDQIESFELVNAISRNCECVFGPMGVRVTTCAPHRGLSEDQRWLNGLVFMRRQRAKLRAEEENPIAGED